MSEPGAVLGIVVAHGEMAIGLTDAVRNITGVGPDALVPLSNRGLSPAALAETIQRAAGTRPTILFTDLPSGSCGVAARLLARNDPNLVVICGVNLPMLLDFVTHRDQSLIELASRLVSKGRSAIACAAPDSGSNGDSPVSR